MKADQRLWDIARHVNAWVNAHVEQVSDPDQFHQAEYWKSATTKGDCEDLAEAKMDRMQAAGFELKDMTLAVCHAPPFGKDDGHCVCIVDVGTGWLVLDNLTDDILPWNETPYKWVERLRTDRSGWEPMP